MPDDEPSQNTTNTTDDYLVGVYSTPSGLTNFLWQSSEASVECDEYEAKDETAQTKVFIQTNHRVKFNIEAFIKNGATLPVPGQEVTLNGVTAPTVSESAGVTTITGGLAFNADGTGSITARVTGTPQITESNTDFIKATFEATAWLTRTVTPAAQ